MSDKNAKNIHSAWNQGKQNWNVNIDASQAGMNEKDREMFERDLGTWLFKSYPKLKLTGPDGQ
jgi:hypothetical protein